MTKQVNVILPENLARRIKSDAAALGVTLNDYGKIAFELFLQKPIANRRTNLDGAKRKIVGRRVSVK